MYSFSSLTPPFHFCLSNVSVTQVFFLKKQVPFPWPLYSITISTWSCQGKKKKSRRLWPQQIFILPGLQHLERGQKFCWDNSINLFPLAFCLTQSKNTEKISWAMFSYEKAETNRCFLPPQVSLEEFIPEEGHQASLGCAMLWGHWENLFLKAPVSPRWPHYVADLETFSFEHWSSASVII